MLPNRENDWKYRVRIQWFSIFHAKDLAIAQHAKEKKMPNEKLILRFKKEKKTHSHRKRYQIFYALSLLLLISVAWVHLCGFLQSSRVFNANTYRALPFPLHSKHRTVNNNEDLSSENNTITLAFTCWISKVKWTRKLTRYSSATQPSDLKCATPTAFLMILSGCLSAVRMKFNKYKFFD